MNRIRLTLTVLLLSLFAGCGSVTTIERAEAPRIVDVKDYDQEIVSTRQISGFQISAPLIKLNGGERLIINVSEQFVSDFNQFHDWKESFATTSVKHADKGGCAYELVLAPVGLFVNTLFKGDPLNAFSACASEETTLAPNVIHPKDAPRMVGTVRRNGSEPYRGTALLQQQGITKMQIQFDNGIGQILGQNIDAIFDDTPSKFELVFTEDPKRVAYTFSADVQLLRQEAFFRKIKYEEIIGNWAKADEECIRKVLRESSANRKRCYAAYKSSDGQEECVASDRQSARGLSYQCATSYGYEIVNSYASPWELIRPSSDY